jgi:hypothetical protein
MFTMYHWQDPERHSLEIKPIILTLIIETIQIIIISISIKIQLIHLVHLKPLQVNSFIVSILL